MNDTITHRFSRREFAALLFGLTLTSGASPVFAAVDPAEGYISVAGAELAAHLARAGLIDEYRLYMHPVVLGGGKPYFQSGLSLALKSLGTESLTQGVTLLRYAPVA